MGSWGTAPWDNDTSADWFAAALAYDTPAWIHAELKAVDEGKSLFSDSTYAAVWLLSRIGLNYVYNIEYLNEDITRAVELVDRYGETYIERYYTPADRDQVTAWLASIVRELTEPKPPGLLGRLAGLQ